MPRKKNNTRSARRPRIVVLEGLRDSASCVRVAGGEPIVVSPRIAESADELLALQFDGLLLTGGGDVDPKLYGETPHRRVYGVSEVRDYVEWCALDAARDLDAVVLGICRGMQLIAVHNGGRLKQHIDGHRNTKHLVLSERGSRFGRIIKGHGSFVSLHHQRVLRTGPGFRVGGRCIERGIEAIESRDGRVLGVQFHPEMDYWSNDGSRRLFRWLVVEAAKRGGMPIPPEESIRRPVRTSYPRPVGRAPQLSLLADEAREPRRRKPVRPMASRWFCRDCGMEFDAQQDRDDHEYWICGTPTMRTTEPPPGHPDWITPGPKDAA